ncbi:hypothetical protein CYMTET_31580 [Cymbomonas tetramitiformis]|uniref:Uncharacterized protein n=1 Tax=Cymbomonas tetramitiformis TaxID=36881 RepID=A0AAE0FH93_9CHLO|nr:hypothetical protein CYMTET_31580 [Cymbomonas tetramitiformis]
MQTNIFPVGLVRRPLSRPSEVKLLTYSLSSTSNRLRVVQVNAGRNQKQKAARKSAAAKEVSRTEITEEQKAAANEMAQDAARIAKAAQEKAKERAATVASEPFAPRVKPKPPKVEPKPEPVKPVAKQVSEEQEPNYQYAIAIAGFLAILAAFYGFAAVLSTALVEALFPLIFGSK